MLFLPGPVSGTVAAENAYASRGFGNHDADRQFGTVHGCDRLLITMSADLAPGGGGVTRQAAVKDDHRATEHRGCLEESIPWIRGVRSLVMSFRTTLRTGKIKTLHGWMNKASASGIYKMQRFVRTLKQDQSAVDAAVEQSWSNGPVKGQINLSID
jgi:hypothetical protein